MSSSDRNTSSQEGVSSFVAFLRQNIRYISAGVLLILLIFVLAKFTGGKENQPEEEPQVVVATEAVEETEPSEVFGEYEDYQVDAYPAVNDLFNRYFAAYAEGDMDAMASIATPVSEKEQSYIKMLSQYVEKYENLKCYTKSGLEEGSYLVCAYTEVKFNDIDATAPSMDTFYVRTDEHGTIYIDNLYSQYNSIYEENPVDSMVQARVNRFANEDDIVKLRDDIVSRYDAVVDSDETLRTMLQDTVPGAVDKWIAEEQPGIREEVAEADGSEEPASETDSETASESEPETTEPSEPAVSETVYAVERVNVRAAASTDSEKLGNIEISQEVTRTGTEGEWSIIDFNGRKAYVKSEFLQVKDDAAGTSDNAGQTTADNNADTAGALTEGAVIEIPESINVRSGMSETSDKIGTAYAGETVKVVMSYAEGWTQVVWNGKTGYIKTSLLQ